VSLLEARLAIVVSVQSASHVVSNIECSWHRVANLRRAREQGPKQGTGVRGIVSVVLAILGVHELSGSVPLSFACLMRALCCSNALALKRRRLVVGIRWMGGLSLDD
jgi:hypothetical protein